MQRLRLDAADGDQDAIDLLQAIAAHEATLSPGERACRDLAEAGDEEAIEALADLEAIRAARRPPPSRGPRGDGGAGADPYELTGIPPALTEAEELAEAARLALMRKSALIANKPR